MTVLQIRPDEPPSGPSEVSPSFGPGALHLRRSESVMESHTFSRPRSSFPHILVATLSGTDVLNVVVPAGIKLPGS